jgi:hypothetical protein
MAENRFPPAFTIAQTKPGSRWYVIITWPSGQKRAIPGFESAIEAKDWIANKSATWLQELDSDVVPERPA